jgi:hypothetical protein
MDFSVYYLSYNCGDNVCRYRLVIWEKNVVALSAEESCILELATKTSPLHGILSVFFWEDVEQNLLLVRLKNVKLSL